MTHDGDAEAMSLDRSFTLFADLPTEIRLMIWEAAIPEEVHPRSKIFAIWGDKPAITPRAIANIRLLACCHESRHLAEKNGIFVPLRRLLPGQGPPKLVWIDRNVEIVSISFEPFFLDRIIRLPPTVTTLADTIGNTYNPLSEETAGKYIEKWRKERVVDIDTLYFGLDDQLPIDYKENRDARRVHVSSRRFGGICII